MTLVLKFDPHMKHKDKEMDRHDWKNIYIYPHTRMLIIANFSQTWRKNVIYDFFSLSFAVGCKFCSW